MNQQKSILFYHVFVINNWKEVSDVVLRNIPHDEICVHICFKVTRIFDLIFAYRYFKSISKVSNIKFSLNQKSSPEVTGFKKLLAGIQINNYSILTYMHSKGVTKPNNPFIKDWVELMRYFHCDRFDLIKNSFAQGYYLYGVNLIETTIDNNDYGPFQLSPFHFSGNYITVNLEKLRDKLSTVQIDKSYFGLEGYWGKLCKVERVICIHNAYHTIKNHYIESYPPSNYK